MPIPTHHANGVSAAAAAADITPALPVGWAADDIWLLPVDNWPNDAAPAAPDGWFSVADSPQASPSSASAADCRLSVFWRRAVAGDTAPTVTHAGNHIVGIIVGFRGCVTAGDPWDVTAGDAAGTSVTVTIPGDTTTVADCLIVAIAAGGDDVTYGTWVNASLATPSVAQIATAITALGNDGSVVVATGGKAAAGVVSVTTAVASATVEQGRIMVALKGAAGGAAASVPPRSPYAQLLAQ